MFGRYALPSDELVTTLSPTITASADDPDYPATNLTDPNPANPAKLTTTDGNWVFDFGAAVQAVAVALIYHNLDEGLSAVLEWNTTDSWGSPAGSQAITIPAWTEEPLDGSFSPWTEIAGTPSYRYWRLVVGDGSPNNSNLIFIGNVMLVGALRQLDTDVRWGIEEREEFGLLEQETELGVEYVEVLGGKRRRFVGEMGLRDYEAAELISLYRSATGRAARWLLIPDETVNDAWYVRFDDPGWSRMRTDPNFNTFPYAVRECSRGVPWP